MKPVIMLSLIAMVVCPGYADEDHLTFNTSEKNLRAVSTTLFTWGIFLGISIMVFTGFMTNNLPEGSEVPSGGETPTPPNTPDTDINVPETPLDNLPETDINNP